MSDTDVAKFEVLSNRWESKIVSTVLQAILTGHLHFGILNTERENRPDLFLLFSRPNFSVFFYRDQIHLSNILSYLHRRIFS